MTNNAGLIVVFSLLFLAFLIFSKAYEGDS